MHPMIVLDASVWVSRLIRTDVNFQASQQWIDTYEVKGGQITAPSLLLVEIAASIARRTNRPKLARALVKRVSEMNNLTVESISKELVTDTITVAGDLRLRAVDALYVDLAQKLGVPLVSWDQEQLQRAGPLIETYRPDNYPF